ncbi:MAG: hypothetical protein ACODAJ_13610 [Planctomycetota bacterium]
MARRPKMRATYAAGCLLLAGAVVAAGDAPVRAEPFRHTLRGMFAKSSIGLKQRPWHQHVLYYLPSRALDLVDCIGLELGIGRGGHVNVRATRLLQVGYGYAESTRIGLESRHPGVVEEELRERAAGWWWLFELQRQPIRGGGARLDICEADVASRYIKEVDPAGIGVSLFAGVVGVSVELKTHEVLDFIKGFATIDSIEDDL